MSSAPVLDIHYTRVQMFPLHNAVASRNYGEVKKLVAGGYDVNEQHYDRVTPLHMACLTGDMEIVQFLLAKGALINSQSIDNSTPLCDASAGGSVDCVRLLLSKGAQVNPPLCLSTPLHEASLRGYADVVALLVAAGARLHANDLHYGTPLHAACSMRTPITACIRNLVVSGSNVNALRNHRTPLHLIAMNSKNVEAGKLLLSYGANPYLRDGLGHTARELAGNSALARVLADHECSPKPLTQCCRLVIRSQLGPARLRFIKKLEAPAILIGYLH